MTSEKKPFWILLIIAVLTLLPFIGMTDFHTKGEPREAVVAQAMLSSGNWILPESAGGDMAYKPPFFHWCIALFSLPLGKVTEFTSRLPSALGMIIMALSFFIFYSRRLSTTRAIVAVLLFISSFEMHRAAMNARVDMLLTAMSVMAILQLFKWHEKGMAGVPFWGVILMSLAVLTKGPVGIIVPCGVVAVYMFFQGERFFRIVYKMIIVALLSCILPMVWYYLAYKQGGQEFLLLVKEENIDRFTGKMGYESHVRPFYYNIITLITGWIPWTLLFVFALFTKRLLPLKKTLVDGWNRLRYWGGGPSGARALAFWAIVIVLVFYTIPKSKRSVYLMVMYPFMGVFLADYFLALMKRGMNAWKVFGLFIGGLMTAVLMIWGIIKMGFFSPEYLFSENITEKIMMFVTALKDYELNLQGIFCIIIAVLAMLVFFKSRLENNNHLRYIYVVFALVFSFQLLLDGVFQPAILNSKSTKDFAMQIDSIKPSGDIYGYMKDAGMLRFYIVNFYTNDRVIAFDENAVAPGYVLSGKKSYQWLQDDYGNRFRFRPIISTRHSNTEIKDTIVLYEFTRQ